MKHIVIISFLALIFMLTSFTKLELSEYKLKTIVIDAGHGGKDPGCKGEKSIEATVALKVALKLGQIINENLPDIKIIYTRDSNNFVELHDRARLANKNNAQLFISIHCNAGPSTIYGTETYTMGLHTTEKNLRLAQRENSVILTEENYLEKYDGFDPNSPTAYILFANFQHAYLENSINFAQKVETQFETLVGRKSRGVMQAGFLVLWKTTMPSVLIEIGYLTNSNEEKYLNKPMGQTYIASGIYNALKEYKEELESMN